MDEHGGAEGLHNLPKVTELASVRARTPIRLRSSEVRITHYTTPFQDIPVGKPQEGLNKGNSLRYCLIQGRKTLLPSAFPISLSPCLHPEPCCSGSVQWFLPGRIWLLSGLLPMSGDFWLVVRPGGILRVYRRRRSGMLRSVLECTRQPHIQIQPKVSGSGALRSRLRPGLQQSR